ncbi:LysM peptidoglycan-binding domain-containing protein [Daejeonella sp.]|uniref:DPBB and LysM peptidoglycan-binding domain-containing protein n=1 Tax=Daejeonella sp. TaxID=2805397 RepID=UPI003982F374
MLIRLVLSFCFGVAFFTANASIKIDSISVENLNGKKTIVHKVEVKETYYSIGRKYNVTPQAIIQFNSNRTLQIGTILRVPTERSYAEAQIPAPSQNPLTSPSKMAVIDYKVGPREYLIAIARKFNTTVEDIKTLNNLTSSNLAIGQIIKVPYGTATEITPPLAVRIDTPRVEPRTSSTEIDSNKNAIDRLKLPPARYGLREVDQHGVAIWISDENLDGTKMLALHQTAPIGTIIKITNPMSGKSTFTKVVGKFTQNESTRDAIIVITKATADMVGALDKRFQATLVYGVPNE